jgi:hypothetical protein
LPGFLQESVKLLGQPRVSPPDLTLGTVWRDHPEAAYTVRFVGPTVLGTGLSVGRSVATHRKNFYCCTAECFASLARAVVATSFISPLELEPEPVVTSSRLKWLQEWGILEESCYECVHELRGKREEEWEQLALHHIDQALLHFSCKERLGKRCQTCQGRHHIGCCQGGRRAYPFDVKSAGPPPFLA